MEFARFMSGTAGRLIRIAAGLGLILVGILIIQGTVGIIMAVVGAVPLLAGLFDFCVFAPLFGGPFLGKEARHA